jgi:hypothetical protein
MLAIDTNVLVQLVARDDTTRFASKFIGEREIIQKWKMPPRECSAAKAQFPVVFSVGSKLTVNEPAQNTKFLTVPDDRPSITHVTCLSVLGGHD